MFFEKNHSVREGFKPKNLWGVIRAAAPAMALCTVMGIGVVRMMSATWTPGGPSRYEYFITQPFVMMRYFAMFFLPVKLSADTDWRAAASILDIRVMAGFLFVVAMLYIAYIASGKRETRPVSFGILWFFIALMPTSSLIPLAEVTNDHRMFFPFVGLMIAVCWAAGLVVIRNEAVLSRSAAMKAMAVTFASAIQIGHAYGTYRRNNVWRTEESLWRNVTVKSPGNARGLMNYGTILSDNRLRQRASDQSSQFIREKQSGAGDTATKPGSSSVAAPLMTAA